MKLTERMANLLTRGAFEKHAKMAKQYTSFLKSAGQTVDRPFIDGSRSDDDSKIQIPRYPRSIDDLYRIMRECSVAATCKKELRNQIFRRGWEWKEVYSAKCSFCGKEYDDLDPDESSCEECGGPLDAPPQKETDYLDALLRSCNENHQDILAVFGEVEDDLNTVDDGYLIIRQRYHQDAEGAIARREIVEIISGDPRVMRLVADDTGKMGGLFYTCLQHREVKLKDKSARCPQCNQPLFDVHYVSQRGKAGADDIDEAFIEGEVIHVSKYQPCLLYGQAPPAVVLWNEMTALTYMTRWQSTLWEKGRMPKGVGVAATMNPDSFYATWMTEMEKVRADPHYIPVITVEPATSDGKAGLDFVTFMPDAREMEYSNVRDELRERISAYMGVSNVFLADTSSSGGLNNEGMQVLVTNRAAEVGQAVYNNVMFPALCRIVGVRAHIPRLLPPEERDERSELETQSLKIQNAAAMAALGFEVSLDEYGEFEFSRQPKKSEPQMQQPMPMDETPQQPSTTDDFGGSPEVPEMAGKASCPDCPVCGSKTEPRKRRGLDGKPTIRACWCPECMDYIDLEGKTAKAGGVIAVADEIQKALESALENTWNSVQGGFRVETHEEWVQNAVKALETALRATIEAHLRKALDEGYRKALPGMRKASQMKPDAKFIDMIRRSAVWRAFDTFGQELTQKMNTAIKTVLTSEEPSVENIITELRKIVAEERYRLERIARTEGHSFVLNGREMAFRMSDPKGAWLYDWAGPTDHRTSPVCNAIKQQVQREGRGDGVPLDRLKAIIKEQAMKFNGPTWKYRDWQPHINCRHTAIKTGKVTKK